MSALEAEFLCAIAGFSIVMAFLMVFFVVTLIRYQRRHAKLYLEKLSAEMEALELERRRIASNLHDDIGPVLSMIKLQISSNMEERDTVLLGNAADNVDYVVNHIRRLNEALVSPVLEQYGLAEALYHTAKLINQLGGLQVYVRIKLQAKHLPVAVALQLYRIVQEGLNNTMRHAQATKFVVELQTDGHYIMLAMMDDGIGFDKKDLLGRKGLGISNIMSRVELLGGKVRLDASKGKGVQYFFTIPLMHGEKINKASCSG